MLLPHNAVVAVVDGTSLAVFRNRGKAHVELESMETPSLREQHDGAGHHHSSPANPDVATMVEDSHAITVANWMNRQVLHGKIDALFVIAAPRTLGELRPHYHSELRCRLLGEEARELVGHPVSEIEALIAAAR